MLKRFLLSAALIAALALVISPAARAQQQKGCSVTINGQEVQFSLPCPPTSPNDNDAGVADRILAGRPQTASDLETSYNCFFYVQTNVLGGMPIDFLGGRVTDPANWSLKEAAHQVPGTDYFNESFLREQGFHFVAMKGDLSDPIYMPGDVVLVPGQDNSVKMNEQFKHVGIVFGTNGHGLITRIRQKFDPFNRVIDLTPAEFEDVYQPQAVGNFPALYRVYRHPPFYGQIKVSTGTYRGNDGYLYATSQLIKVIVFWFTPDGAQLGPSPLNSRNGGLYVAAEGVFHRTANGPYYRLLALFDAQGRARQFNQTIPLYTCSSTIGTAC